MPKVIFILFFLSLFKISAQTAEPNDQETLMLEIINRMRANPPADTDRMLDGSVRIPGMVDIKMFKKEMSVIKPSQPLVFNLQIMKAARDHAKYMIDNNEQTHNQEKGKKSFTGVKPGDRAKRAGYKYMMFAENAFLHARSMWHAHTAYMVDWGDSGNGSVGGMQTGRGHRKNLTDPRFREIGIGTLPRGSNGMFSNIQNFGARKNTRFAGGVAYKDNNGNGLYDIGEGLSGVSFTADGETVKSWGSGAYTLPIKSGSVRITAKYNGKTFTKSFSGDENVKFDFIVSKKTDFTQLDKWIAAFEKYEEGTLTHLKYSILLNEKAKDFVLDDVRENKIKKLSGSVLTELNSIQDEILSKVDDDVNAANKLIAKGYKKYKSTAAGSWFNDASMYVRWRARYILMSREKEKFNRVNKLTHQNVMSLIKSGSIRLKTDFWKKKTSSLKAQVDSLS